MKISTQNLASENFKPFRLIIDIENKTDLEDVYARFYFHIEDVKQYFKFTSQGITEHNLIELLKNKYERI